MHPPAYATGLVRVDRRRAIEAAELELAHSNTVTIPAKDWERFNAWADEPGRDRPELRRLAQESLANRT